MMGILEQIQADIAELKALVRELLDRQPTVEGALTVDEAAKLLTVSSRTIRSHIASKAIRSVKLEGRILIPRSVIQEMLNPGAKDTQADFPTGKKGTK
jgi:excisionase family DNA binding protein